MTQKQVFTLFNNNSVDIAPGAKKISKEAYESVLDCQNIISKTKEDSVAYQKQVAQECEAIKERAYEDGFEAGYNEWVKMVGYLEKEISHVHEELQKTVLPVALKAAKKIVGAELETNKEAIINIVMNTLKNIAQHKRVVLYVSKQDFDAIEGAKSKFKPIFEELESLSVREKDEVEPGGCIIETEVGIVNARLPNRWKTLEAAFEALTQSLLEKKESV